MFRNGTLRHTARGFVMLVAALALVSCSDSETSSRVASLKESPTSAAPEKVGDDEEAYLVSMREFVDCTRKAGFPEMSDPTELGGIIREDLLRLQEAADGKTILKKCYPIIDGLPVPQELQEKRAAEETADLSDEQRAANIEFSKCMQENGVPEFPDPQPNGLQAIEPWARPDAPSARPPRLQEALDVCHRILDPVDP